MAAKEEIKKEKVDEHTFPIESFLCDQEEYVIEKIENKKEEIKEYWDREIELAEEYHPDNPEKVIELEKKKQKELEELEKEKEKAIRELHRQIGILDRKMLKLSKKLFEKFKGWVIEHHDTGGIDGHIWWEKWELRNPKTGETAEVWISVDWEKSGNSYVGTYSIVWEYVIFDRNREKIEEKEGVIYPY